MAETGSGSTGILSLLRDPNVINLLAGIGSKLDPEGVGGILGGATQTLTRNTAAQKAFGEQEELRTKNNELLKQIIQLMSPAGSPGPTNIKIGSDG